MCLDSQGNLYVAAGLNNRFSPGEDNSAKGGVHIFSPQGQALGFIPTVEDAITNCAFGDADLKTLYITAGTALWKIRLNATGYSLKAIRK